MCVLSFLQYEVEKTHLTWKVRTFMGGGDILVLLIVKILGLSLEFSLHYI